MHFFTAESDMDIDLEDDSPSKMIKASSTVEPNEDLAKNTVLNSAPNGESLVLVQHANPVNDCSNATAKGVPSIANFSFPSYLICTYIDPGVEMDIDLIPCGPTKSFPDSHKQPATSSDSRETPVGQDADPVKFSGATPKSMTSMLALHTTAQISFFFHSKKEVV